MEADDGDVAGETGWQDAVGGESCWGADDG